MAPERESDEQGPENEANTEPASLGVVLAELESRNEAEEERDDDGGTGIPWWPLFIYLVAILFYGLWITDGNLHARLPYQAGWLFVPVFLYLGVGSYAAGRAPLRGSPIRRDTHPGAFWSLVITYFTAALAMALMGLGVFE